MAKKGFGKERRSESAKWESKEIGRTDFNEDYKLRTPGSFEKGSKPKEDHVDEYWKEVGF